MKYIQLKDKSNSRGALVGGVLFNNSTVVACEDGGIPIRAKQLLKQGVLELTTKAEYDKYSKLQEEGKENAKKQMLANKRAKKAQLEAKGFIEEEKPKEVKKEEPKVAPKARTKTAPKTEDKK